MSLGFDEILGEKSPISMLDIATSELNTAIVLFCEGNFICSAVLAGAAEEIFGKIAEESGAKSVISSSLEMTKKIQQMGYDPLRGRGEKDVINEWNRAKNKYKHYDAGVSQIVTSPISDAYWLIRRGIENAKSAGAANILTDDFENKFCELNL